MASKPKTKTFTAQHRGRAYHGGFTILGSYRVGARNEKEAEDFVKTVVGKHAKVKCFLKPHLTPLAHGEVVEVYKKEGKGSGTK